MNPRPEGGIPSARLDAESEADEARKSALILEARMLHDQQQPEVAADKFAEAAAIEERLAAACDSRGLHQRALVHGFSAASCWAHAGDFHHAIVLCDRLLAREDLPD